MAQERAARSPIAAHRQQGRSTWRNRGNKALNATRCKPCPPRRRWQGFGMGPLINAQSQWAKTRPKSKEALRFIARADGPMGLVVGVWRRGPESNRTDRICNPGHNRFATAPGIREPSDKKGHRPFFVTIGAGESKPSPGSKRKERGFPLPATNRHSMRCFFEPPAQKPTSPRFYTDRAPLTPRGWPNEARPDVCPAPHVRHAKVRQALIIRTRSTTAGGADHAREGRARWPSDRACSCTAQAG